MYKEREAQIQINIIRDLGYHVEPDSVILDLGCGNGDTVMGYRNRGYQAFGCDYVFCEGANVDKLSEAGIIRKIDGAPYRLPFPDNTFDVVVSDQVFEHVKDYEATLSEISRVLKPEGVSLHCFPSRYAPVEPHVHVPLATVLQQRWWLSLWARLGVRKDRQHGMSVAEVVQRNFKFLREETNYLSRTNILRYFSAYFRDIVFCEDLFIKNNQGTKKSFFLYQLSRTFRVVPKIYSMMRMVVIFARNNKGQRATE